MSSISQDEVENEHPFDPIIRLGYGLPIISFLYAHDASALGCVNQQCAEAVRWQREKGNLIPIWSEDDKGCITLQYKNVNITTNFPVIYISLKTITIDLIKRDFRHFNYRQMIKNGEITLDQNNKIYVITLSGNYIDHDGYGNGYYEHQKEVVVYKGDSKVYYDTYKHFKKIRQIRLDREEAIRVAAEAEKKRLDAIRLEEEKKRLYLEKHTIRIPAQYMNKPNPWKKLPKVDAAKI
jgi:hypothetical protein